MNEARKAKIRKLTLLVGLYKSMRRAVRYVFFLGEFAAIPVHAGKGSQAFRRDVGRPFPLS